MGHFRDESCQAIDCASRPTDNQKQGNKTLLFWYAFTAFAQEMEWALFLQPQSPRGDQTSKFTTIVTLQGISFQTR